MTGMPQPFSPHDELPARVPRATRARRRLTLVVLLVACLGFALTLELNSRASLSAPAVVPSSKTAAGFETTGAQTSGGGDFSRFAHTNPNHSRLPCLLCHRREDNSPRPTLPGHLPCSGCHTQQFADTNSPICAICHTDARSGSVKSFPGLRSFNVRFDHARHARGAARPRASCAACHKPARGGVALSIPAGFGAHNTCYACHSPRAQSPAGGDISSCSTCHRDGRHARTPERARAYQVNFSHAKHGARQRLGCNDCHSVRAGMAQGRQVTAPQPLMHHAAPRAQSCMTCHNDRRAFGGDDFTDCKRCHTGNAWHF
jgi:c(7)-type cytochrome triheme protein